MFSILGKLNALAKELKEKERKERIKMRQKTEGSSDVSTTFLPIVNLKRSSYVIVSPLFVKYNIKYCCVITTLTLSFLDGPYVPITNTGKDDFSGVKYKIL